ncbi:ATP-binding cassette domain-containing protein [Oceanobacillus sp. 143]|nr:ATP-binding cassette domain-containing protein [Oceanobacillus sp. 143]
MDGITFRYKKGPYLFKNLHLVVNPGEVVGIHGYSGSGKTTMAQIIAGYIKAETGNVLVDRKKGKHSGMNPVQLIWQHPEKAINPRWQMKKVLAECGMLDNELLAELGIKQEWFSRYPSELSGGELQRFCVARALHLNVKYIIADEITTMLDAITQARLWKTIVKLAKMRSVGVLVISHDVQLLNKICDRQIDFEDITNV